jgi:hypothetical protein
MAELKLLRVGVRMLLDYLKVMDEKEDDFEIGCKCKDVFTAEALVKFLDATLKTFPATVSLKDGLIVVILPKKISPASSENVSPSPQSLRYDN